MAYTIIKSDGTVLTTIADGTINTTSTSLGLPGRNFAGYGQALDTNFVHQLENFADSSPPTNPIRGQLWYNTNTSTLYVCPTDGEINAANWLALASTSSGGTTTFGAVTVQGTLQANLVTAITSVTAADGIFTNLAVSGIATMTNANINSAGVGSLTTPIITAGSATTQGSLTGTWTVTGGATGNTLIVDGGNVFVSAGIIASSFTFPNGTPITPTGVYTNQNVNEYLQGIGNISVANRFQGNIYPNSVYASNGTASIPAYTANSDTNTGIYFPAADTIGFSLNGNEGVRINSSGNVGIGTNDPTQKLAVVGNANITGNISTVGITATGNLSVDNITATGNISTVGITATGNLSVDNITATGNITANTIISSQNPKFFLVPDVDYSITGTGFFRLDTAIYNVGNGNLSSSGTSFRVPVSGYYQLNVGYRALIDATSNVTFTLSSTNTITSLTTTWTTSRNQFDSGAGNTTGYFGTIAFLTPTDQLSIGVAVGEAANLAISNSSRSSFFSGFLIP